MTENKDEQLPGAPVADEPATASDVADAIARAQEADPAVAAEAAVAADAAATAEATHEEPFAAAAESVAGDENAVVIPEAVVESAAVPTENIAAETEVAAAPVLDEIPSAGADPLSTETRPYTAEEAAEAAAAANVKATDSNLVTISKDHPMAGFYTEAPVPPEIKGNRLAGVLISLLGTVIFAAVYAGVLALFQLPQHGTANLVNELVPYLVSPGFWGAAIGFFIGMVILVLIFGRAGWWAYVLGGFFVGVLTWAVSAFGFSFSPELFSNTFSFRALLRFNPEAWSEMGQLASGWMVIAAGLVAREVTVWFGAWIGKRGRKVTAKNKAAQAAYDAALAETSPAAN